MSKKSKRYSPGSSSTLIPDLPDALALHCLARVPGQYHQAPAVSKPIRSAVSSPDFFEVRSRIGISEEVLFIRVRAPFHVSALWFALYPTAEGNLFQVPIPPHPQPGLYNSAAAALGSTIYVFGGCTPDPATRRPVSTSAVWALNCRSKEWVPVAPMGSARGRPFAAVLDGRIYLVEDVGSDKPFAEVLDVSSGRWVPLPEPPVERSTFRVHAVAADCGMIRVWGLCEELKFDPVRWEWTEPVPLAGTFGSTNYWCLFKGAIYAHDIQVAKIKRLEEGGREFKEVEGAAEGLPGDRWWGPKLVNAGRDKLVAMVCSGAGHNLDARTLPNVRSNPLWWASLTREPFKAWFAEIEVSEVERVGYVVWLKNVLSQRWPDHPQGIAFAPINFSDWNLFQVSL